MDRNNVVRWAAATALSLCCIQAGVASRGSVWFADDFHQGRTTPWKTVSGEWQQTDSSMSISTNSYDHFLACPTYVYGFKPCTIEASLRGPRAGIFFNLDDTTSKALSHMVRFEEKTLLAGYFNGSGEFVATSSFDLPRAATDWTVLRVDLDPEHRRYTIAVNDSVIGVDTVLRFPSGFAGLQGSDGISEFRSFAIRGEEPQGDLPALEPGRVVPLRHIRLFRNGGRLAVYDPERRSYLHLDKEGKLLRARPAKQAPRPPLIASSGERTYRIRGATVLIEQPRGTVIDSITERLMAPSAIVVPNDTSLYIADAGANAVLLFDRNGRFVQSFDAPANGGFTALHGMQQYDHKTLVAADYDRLVLVPISMDEGKPVVSALSPTGVEVTWPCGGTRMIESAPGGNPEYGRPAEGSLNFAADGGEWTTTAGALSQDWRSRVVRLEGLLPLHRYSFRVTPVYGTIPPPTTSSREYRFTTPPDDPAAMALTRLPILCMIYRTISYGDVYPADRYPRIPRGRTISDDELDYLRAACTFNSAFYFRNSGCRMMLDFDIHVVEDTLFLRDVGAADPYWLSLTDRVTRDFEHAAAVLRKTTEHYNGLIVPYAWVNYPPRRTSALRDPSTSDSITIRQMYGGGTFGVPAPWKYGKTSGYTGNPFQDRFSRQDWLITHEFHHQVDALMEASGYAAYYHADQPWKMPGRFGEDFDFNARIMRNADPASWLNLKFGTLTATPDADRDGVPDDDPSLPFDERRLFGDTTRTDTDGDGLTDLVEILAGSEHGTALNVRDTDGDHIDDGIDPEPLYPFPPAIRRLQAGTGTRLDRVTAGEFARLDSVTVFHLAWDDSSLFAGYTHTGKASDTLGFLLQIDAANDGWFHGFDNTQIRVRHTMDSDTVVDYYLRDCASWIDPPRDRKDILTTNSLPVVSDSRLLPDGRISTRLIIRISGNPTYGPALIPEARMAIRLGFQTVEDRWVWKELFERNFMMSVRLADTP
jgi:hypothetical protein